MEPLATPSDLADRLADVGEFTDAQTMRAEALLRDASAVVRNYTRQTITLATETVDLESTSEQWLYLPERPVVDVTAVVVGRAPLSPQLYYFQTDGLYRYDGWSGRFYGSTGVWNQPDTIRVTYTHGYAVIPDDIVQVVCKIAKSSWSNPQGMRSFAQGDMAATLDASTVGDGKLDEDDKRVLNFYRRARRSVKFNAGIL